MKILLLLLLINLILTGLTVAKANNFKVDGVLSLGYIAPTSNQLFGSKDGENTIITENAFRVSYNFDNRFSVSSQIMLRDTRGESGVEARIDFLQLDYRNSFWDNSQQTYTIGRFKAQQGFYNETRDITFTRPSIMLPQSVYFEAIRNFVLSLDGIKLNSTHSFDFSDLTFELGAGKSPIDSSLNSAIFGDTATGAWESDTNYYADIKWDNQNISLGINYTDISLDYTPGINSFLPIEVNGFVFSAPLLEGVYRSSSFIYSAQYRLPNWEFTVEHSDYLFDSTGFSFARNTTTSNIKGTYFQTRYFLSDTLFLLARYDVMQDVSATKSSVKSLTEGKDLTLGFTWSFHKQWQVALEHHFLEGILWVPPVTKTTSIEDVDNKWGVSAIQLSYRF